MEKIKIGGREIPLLFNTRSFYGVESEIGALVDLNEKMDGNDRVRNVVKSVFYMGNEGLRAEGQKADLKEDWIWDNMKPYQLPELQVRILNAIHAGWVQETYEEPEVRDGFAEENAKKKDE